MFPDIESREEAAAAVASMRYPQRSRSTGGPGGARGAMAAWYWGLSDADYKERADVWPLNPRGELMAFPMIETPEGVKNINAVNAALSGATSWAKKLGVTL